MLRRFVLVVFAMMALISALPAAAQGAIWNSQFYNNPSLSGQPAATRQDAALGFNWGTGSPNPGINTQNWSARFASDPVLGPGTYRFFVLADDNVKLFVNFPFQPQIDSFASGVVGQVLTADVVIPGGVTHVQVDYRQITGESFLYVTWANLADNPNPQPNFPIAQAAFTPVNNAPWTAQYYANSNLTEPPAGIIGVSGPSGDWGAGAPLPSLPIDNFSARFTSVQTLEAGTYVVTVRADDGVRVYVNGVLVINQWGGATGQTYTASVNLGGGANNFVVEYFEAGGSAFLQYSLNRQGTSGIVNPVPAGVNTGVNATVNAFRLNVRSQPNPNASILTKINRNESYPIVGANGDRTWYQINVNGTVGWVFARFVNVGGNAGNVPTTSSQQTFAAPATTGLVVTALDQVNIRSGPNRTAAIVGKLPINNQAQVVGRNSDSSWWQISYQGISGWVSARFAQLQADARLDQIPVTG